MRKLIITAIALLTLTACSNNSEVIKIADEYTTKNILPLFENAKITDGIRIDRVVFVKDAIKAMNIKTAHQKAYSDRKDSEARSDIFAGTPEANVKLKKFMLSLEIEYDAIKSMDKANYDEGFYLVSTTITDGNNEKNDYTIVLSKDLKVLNTRINPNEVYSRIPGLVIKTDTATTVTDTLTTK